MEDLRVVFFKSRNKDNKHLEGFKKERQKAFLTSRTLDDLIPEFGFFVSQGLDGEFSRMYVSVNARDPEKIHKNLLHYLIDNSDCNPASIEQKVASIAAKPECRLTHKWLFDFDGDEDELKECIKLIPTDMVIKRTVNHFAIICDRGFDTREVLSKWGHLLENKKDGNLCYMWGTKCDLD